MTVLLGGSAREDLARRICRLGVHGSVITRAKGGQAFLRHDSSARGARVVQWHGDLIAIHGSHSDTAHVSNSLVADISSGVDPETAGFSSASVAVFHSDSGDWELRADFAGAFPIYYAAGPGSFLFSTLLRPLAVALAAQPDPAGVIEFVRLGYTLGVRTRFEGIRRLLPGEHLRVRADGSGLFVSQTEALPLSESVPALDDAWHELEKAMSRQMRGCTSAGIMTSGGWDSRFLLSLLRKCAPDASLACYSYGMPTSREIRIASEIAEMAGARTLIGGLGPELLEVDRLRSYYEAADCLLFPHWRLAGERLRETGLEIGMAGVLGEVMGGHYGPPYYFTGGAKAWRVYRSLLGLDSNATANADLNRFWEYFLPGGQLPKPWSVDGEWWNDQRDLGDAVREDLSVELERLAGLGARDSVRLLERFTAEHRGARYQVEQLRALGTEIDVGSPFLDSSLVKYFRTIPFERRLYNRLAAQLLAGNDRRYANLPLAATILPAATPTVLRELSRGVRVGMERAQGHLHRWSLGRIRKPSYSYVDFAFLGEPQVIEPLLDQLRGDLWNRDALRFHYLKYSLMPAHERPNLHPQFDQILKNVTVEWDLRAATTALELE